MAEYLKTFQLELKPIPPDTVSSLKEELMPLIKAILRNAGRENLLSEKQIQIQIEKTFPVDSSVTVVLTMLSNIALEVFKGIILPKLKSRFVVREKQKTMKKKVKSVRKSSRGMKR